MAVEVEVLPTPPFPPKKMKRCVRPALRFSDSSAKVREVVAGGVAAAAVVDMRGIFFLVLLSVCGVWKYVCMCVCVRNDEVVNVHTCRGGRQNTTLFPLPFTYQWHSLQLLQALLVAGGGGGGGKVVWLMPSKCRRGRRRKRVEEGGNCKELLMQQEEEAAEEEERFDGMVIISSSCHFGCCMCG